MHPSDEYAALPAESNVAVSDLRCSILNFHEHRLPKYAQLDAIKFQMRFLWAYGYHPAELTCAILLHPSCERNGPSQAGPGPWRKPLAASQNEDVAVENWKCW